VNVARRRLLAAALDVSLDVLFADRETADIAVGDLTENKLNTQMQAYQLGNLTMVSAPTVSETTVSSSPTVTPFPTALVAGAAGGGVAVLLLACAAALEVRRRDLKHPLTHAERKMFREKAFDAAKHGGHGGEAKMGEKSKLLTTAKQVDATSGLEALMCVDLEGFKQDFYIAVGKGVEGIREEVDAFVAMAQDYAEQMHGWVEDKEEQLKAVEAEVIQIKDVKDILTYVLSPAGTKKEGKTVYVNGIIDAAYVNDIIDEVTSSVSKGLGAYLSYPKALQAGLKVEHVVALRL